ncbi:monovalent cation/H+ antiporter complex subunit F [Deinococcus radiodurans]|jgi:Multisubunit Na+/H+ antiporter, MnhF subunit|uniref:Cation transport system protein, putative n=1 Tax=Deinococcus radiodurans (strain ATCC 13939 / DSM 20539 / JCM 16871 / CCUG 27074 / LMG 4051 / NBRC 15346 / NCIMB 9279 / VKM B-1422 / R1) TaxID=243230 RepID=Q9RVY6_DEIRA|nr:monovalent cation/H+ antiporter complex subunit F [Deinococcus radiodurans]AAF10457.1 cation transport system protein, putative [Deinococcus radiodurans R1 = ATCC 13939 = DSM 20539]ANC71912.1 cation transporter [Deinococcus radiodurans R1 = ATCC 13939 = DSM 20539]QEM70391.1 cation transporter [Deinococcus radiodurans]QIP29000.1 cation transporter [Deinococcus radiodurans]QIP32292.1 cation transporter [Deinococcus radiodurans]
MIINIALGIVTLSVLLVTYRVLRGPSWGDRIMAFDFLSVNLVVLFTLLAVRSRQLVMLDAALVLSLLGFLSTVALTRYLLLGRVMR